MFTRHRYNNVLNCFSLQRYTVERTRVYSTLLQHKLSTDKHTNWNTIYTQHRHSMSTLTPEQWTKLPQHTKSRIALLQLNSQSDTDLNYNNTATLIQRCIDECKPDIILTPENTGRMAGSTTDAAPVDQLHVLEKYRLLCNQYNIILIIGSLAILDPQTQKLYNRQYILIPNKTDKLAHIAAEYNKIHMFDVNISETEQYNESARFIAGNQSYIVQTDRGNIGTTICYDLRFPTLYRKLAQHNAHIITIPAAFTVHTGKLHWEVLLRARAIETGCYIIAAAQVGTHNQTRHTYGHSMIISPDGTVIAENSSTEISYIYADMDLNHVVEQRKLIPSWNNEQQYSINVIDATKLQHPYEVSQCLPSYNTGVK